MKTSKAYEPAPTRWATSAHNYAWAGDYAINQPSEPAGATAPHPSPAAPGITVYRRIPMALFPPHLQL